jgi:predicted LPLAT superfamily acyltransferase
MSWAEENERGSAWLLRIMAVIIRHLGWHTGQALLYPITLWFYLTSPAARAASRGYLGRVLGRPARRADVARHMFTFACVILDRAFFLSGRGRFDIRVLGLEAVTDVLNSGRGCIMLGSHLGSFDVLRALGRNAPVHVHPVMFRMNSGNLTRLLERLAPDLAEDIIELGAPDALLRVQECIERGEIVGVLADRAPGHNRMVVVPFLGSPAAFPAGPIILASVIGAPVVLCFGVRVAPRRYVIRFEPFAQRIALRRTQREAELRVWIEAYCQRLEAACRSHPFNWFNFYPFWETPDG